MTGFEDVEQYEIEAGLIDFTSGVAFDMPSMVEQRDFIDSTYDELYSRVYRVKMKQGVSSISFAGGSDLVWAFDDGLGDGLVKYVDDRIPESVPVGEYAVIFFTTRGRGDDYRRFSINLSEFFSQFEIVYDPLPVFINTSNTGDSLDRGPIIIDSENFSAPNGLFTEVDQSRWSWFQYIHFEGSTFKTAPKIFSELESVELFPGELLSSYRPWSPFAGCDSVEFIEYQGDFKNIQILEGVDFTYQDEDGYDMFDAYPSGGSPVKIENYLTSHGNPVRLSSTFPQFDASELQYISGHMDLKNAVVDSQPQLPFGGIDFSNAKNLEYLKLPVLDIDVLTPTNESIQFTWGSLGITLPQDGRLKYVEGAFDIYQILVNGNVNYEGEPTDEVQTIYEIGNVAPDGESQRYMGWIDQLKDIEDLDENGVPIVPNTVETIVGYYRKHIAGSGAPDNEKGFYDTEIDVMGFPFRNIPSLHSGVKKLYAFCENTFAHERIRHDIVVPAPPSSVEILRDTYRRMFYNAIGAEYELYEEEDSDPGVVLAWSVSSDNERDLDMKLIFNPDKEDASKNQFGALWEASIDFRMFNSHAIVRGIEYTTTSNVVGNAQLPYTPTGSIVYDEYMLPYEELMSLVYDTTPFQAYSRKILNSIEFEVGSYPNLNYSGGWQRECFYGSYAHPEEINLYAPLPQVSEWESYQDNGAYRMFKSQDNDSQKIISGLFLLPEYENDDPEESLEKIRYVNFLLFNTFAHGTGIDEDEYTANYDNILFSGSSRTEGDRVITPYRGGFSPAIKGNISTFAEEHNIHASNLLNDERGIQVHPSGGMPVVINMPGYVFDHGVNSDYLWYDRYELQLIGSRSQSNRVVNGIAHSQLEYLVAPAPNLFQRDINISQIDPRVISRWDITEEMVESWNTWLWYDVPLRLYPEWIYNAFPNVTHTISSQEDIFQVMQHASNSAE